MSDVIVDVVDGEVVDVLVGAAASPVQIAADAAGDSVDITAGEVAATVEVAVDATAGPVEIAVGVQVGDRGPQGDLGPANTLTIGTVTGGETAAATITGTAPNQTLNLTLPKGDTGSTGSQGPTGPAGPANTLAIGTVTTGAAGSSASAVISGAAPSQTLSLTIPRGNAGINGTNGREVQLQVTSTHIQWRYVGDASWTNLVALTAITGPQGAAGSSIELQSTTTHVQWRIAGALTWTDLVALSAITGPAGPAGVSWQAVPMSPISAGANGDIAYDASFLYVKSASGWRRTAIASWTPLGSPTSVSATAGNAQAVVSWVAPVDNGGYSITDYVVQFSSNGGTSWATFSDGTSTATSATVTGLTNETAYIFRVAAITSAGTGPYSPASGSATPSASTPASDQYFSSVSLLLHFDGNADDSSQNGNDATLVGSAAVTGAARFGSASLSVPTSGDYASVPSGAELNFGPNGDFTIECWLKTSNSSFSIMEKGDGVSGWAFFVAENQILFYPFGDLGIAGSAGSVADNQWHHVAISRSSGTCRIHVDGTKQAEGTLTNDFDTTSDLIIGGGVVGSINGLIDEVRITKSYARYGSANFTPPTAPFPNS